MKILGKKPLLFILLLYTLANFLMFLNGGAFWDDWCIYNNYTGLTQIFQGVGLIQMVSVNSFLQNLTNNAPLLYHSLVFLIELFSIGLFYKVSSKYISNQSLVFYLTTFFALIPFNEAKILMCCIQYSIGLLLFLNGCLFFTKRNMLVYRLIALVFFFLSFFFLSSTLILILAFIFFVTLYEIDSSFSIKNLFRKLIYFADFIFIPFAFWIIRSLFFNTKGIYSEQGYNTITIENIKRFPVNFIHTSISSSIGLAYEFIKSIKYNYMFLIIFLILIIAFLVLFRNVRNAINIRNLNKWFYLGIFFFVCGAFAYLVVGKIPSFSGYETRHQVLLKIAVPVILVFFIMLLKKGSLQKITFVLLVSSFIVITMFHNIKFLSSWLKETCLEENFKSSDLIRNNKFFLVIDNTLPLNETEREYLSYCYNGISKQAFGNQSRFFVSKNELDYFKKNISFYNKNEVYNCKDFVYNDNDQKFQIIITNNESRRSIFSLLIMRYVSKEHFNDQVKNYISLTYIPISNL